MHLSNLAMNLRGPWMITPEQAALMAPVLKGVLQGLITEFDKAPEPYSIKLSEFIPAPSGAANPYADKSVFVTNLTGTMFKYDNCDAKGTRSIANELMRADADPSIIGHIIVADSGGGAVNAVWEMADAITKCTKPVVAFVDGLAGSACMYAISYCDKIIASHSTDMVGSIGVLTELSGFTKYAKDGNYVTARIYADASTEKNAGYEAALEGDFKIIKETQLNPLCEKFIADMRQNRPNVKDEQLSGGIFFASDVIGSLVDSIGDLQSAVQAVMDLASAAEGDGDGAQAVNNSNSTIIMKKYPFLLAALALSELVIAADGTTTLQGEQLDNLEAALAQLNGAKDQHKAIVDGLNQQLTDANSTITARDARIKELETSLDAAIARANSAAPADPQVNHAGEGAENAPAQTFEEAMAICNSFLGK